MFLSELLAWALLSAPVSIPAILAMAYLLIAWLKGGMGGADVIVQAAIILLAGFQAFMVIALVSGVYTLLAFLLNKRKTFPAMVPVLLGTAIWAVFTL